MVPGRWCPADGAWHSVDCWEMLAFRQRGTKMVPATWCRNLVPGTFVAAIGIASKATQERNMVTENMVPKNMVPGTLWMWI